MVEKGRHRAGLRLALNTRLFRPSCIALNPPIGFSCMRHSEQRQQIESLAQYRQKRAHRAEAGFSPIGLSRKIRLYPIGKSFPLTGSSPSEIISYSKELNHLITFHREISSVHRKFTKQNHIPHQMCFLSGNHIPIGLTKAVPSMFRRLYVPKVLCSEGSIFHHREIISLFTAHLD